MAGLSSSGTLLNPYVDYGYGGRLNLATNNYETTNGLSSITLATPQVAAINNSLGTNVSSGTGVNNGQNQSSFWDWVFTPLGGAGTKSPGEIGLGALSSLAGLYGTIYSTNKQVGAIRDQIRSNETLARANFANSMSDAAYNRGNYLAMVNGWGNQDFTNQVGQNTLDSLNSLSQAGSSIGVDSNILDKQKQQVQSYMKS